MDMLPVWDFPEFDQLQAEQAEIMWNPEPDLALVQVPSGAAGLVGAPGPAISQNMASENRTGLHDESLWERDFAGMPQGRGPGRSLLQVHEPPESLAAAPGPNTQDSLLPTPSPADHAAEDNDPLELQQRQRTGSSDSTERSKAVNRESQRRFRLRQKV